MLRHANVAVSSSFDAANTPLSSAVPFAFHTLRNPDLYSSEVLEASFILHNSAQTNFILFTEPQLYDPAWKSGG